MPSTLHDEPYRKTLEFHATAQWRCHEDFPQSNDAAATPFGPARVQQWLQPGLQGTGSEPLPVVLPKPVLYVPVKKQNGEERFPPLLVHITNHIQSFGSARVGSVFKTGNPIWIRCPLTSRTRLRARPHWW
jgi:hypothetical protein